MYLSLAWWAELGSQGFPLEEEAYHSQRKGVGLHQGLHLGPTDQTETVYTMKTHNHNNYYYYDDMTSLSVAACKK